MPSKRDVRNNAILDPQYAYLGLHQAALSGNVGLVQYALSQGQPVDAVWDGISALHAAAAGGSEHVARLLIDNGADVNFGRQPKNEREAKTRTGSSSSISPPLDKSSDALGPPHAPESLLNPGSTPLHFACAHNNAAVARLLLAHGAAPHIPDKRGVTPRDLLPPASSPTPTSSSTTQPTSDLLRAVIREYYENEKAKEKEFQKKSQIRFYGKAAAVLGFPQNDDDSKRVAGRRSVEHLSRSPKQAPAQLTSPKHVPVPIPTSSPARRGISNIGSPPPSPRRLPTSSDRERTIPSPPPSSHYIFGSASAAPTTTTAAAGGWVSPPVPFVPSDQRRPSLPHIFDSPTSSSRTVRLPASTSPYGRPRSADGTDTPAFGNGGTSPSISANTTLPALSSTLTNTRPRTKRSLLSLFKKFDMPSDTREREKDAERESMRGRPSFSAGISSLSPSRQHTHREEIHTAPAEQTTFMSSSHDRPRVPEEVFCDDDAFEDYGVPLKIMDSEPPLGSLSFNPMPEPSFANSGQGENNGDEYSSDDDREGTVEERTSTDTRRADPIPIPPRHTEGTTGLGLGLRLGGTPVGNDTPLPPPAPPPPPLPPAMRLSPRARRGILRGDFSVRRSGSRGALRFEGTLRASESRGSLVDKRERASPLLRETTSPSRKDVGGPSLRERSSGGSLRLIAGAHLAVDNRLRGDSLSSAKSYASHDTSTGTMASTGTAASMPSLDPDTTRNVYSSEDDDDEGEDEVDEMEVPELGLNIRTVSNHAQAEALVQKAAKEILELNAFTEGSNLSAQLAAYGEKVQLERRFARGEAQRFKSPTRSRFESDPVGGEEEEDEVEVEWWKDEERRKGGQERMMMSQKSMERYARGVSKERRSTEAAKEREKAGAECPLERTTSLEMEVGTVETKRPKKPRSPKLRRPHTSDSVASAASGSTAPRFGHGSTQSSGTLLRSPSEQGRRVRHQASQSTSVHLPPRAESLDYGPRTVSSPEFEEGEDVVVPHATTHTSSNRSPNRSPFGQSSHSPSMPATSSAFMASTVTVDEFGTSGRPLKQRIGGGIRSLFGKSK